MIGTYKKFLKVCVLGKDAMRLTCECKLANLRVRDVSFKDVLVAECLLITLTINVLQVVIELKNHLQKNVQIQNVKRGLMKCHIVQLVSASSVVKSFEMTSC